MKAELGAIRQSSHKQPRLDRLFYVVEGNGPFAYYTAHCWGVRLQGTLDMTAVSDGTLAGVVVKQYKNGMVWLRVRGPMPVDAMLSFWADKMGFNT